jgi:hypothetical protein
MIDKLRPYLTRDSKLWTVLIVLSLIVGALSALRACDPHVTNCVTDPSTLAYYGVPDAWLPALRLGALISGIVSGVMKTSPQPHSDFGKAKLTPEDRKA